MLFLSEGQTFFLSWSLNQRFPIYFAHNLGRNTILSFLLFSLTIVLFSKCQHLDLKLYLIQSMAESVLDLSPRGELLSFSNKSPTPFGIYSCQKKWLEIKVGCLGQKSLKTTFCTSMNFRALPSQQNSKLQIFFSLIDFYSFPLWLTQCFVLWQQMRYFQGYLSFLHGAPSVLLDKKPLFRVKISLELEDFIQKRACSRMQSYSEHRPTVPWHLSNPIPYALMVIYDNHLSKSYGSYQVVIFEGSLVAK